MAGGSVHEPLGHSPAHGRFGEIGDRSGVGETAEAVLSRDILVQILQIAVEDGDRLLPGGDHIGGETVVPDSEHDAVCGGPVHGLGEIPAGGHVGEAGAAAFR